MSVTIQRAADTLRILAADIVEHAGSGHPGLPMGCADFAFSLWYGFLRHDPQRPDWFARDRFILSAGHGSALLYGLLHLFGYDLGIDDLRAFRRFRSRTPGHPEYGLTPGVEASTGPLGTGFAAAVGMAAAAKQLAARMDEPDLFDQRMFVLAGDGCMMEGVTHEAAALAGCYALDNLICFYDDNRCIAEGPSHLASSEDTGQRFQSCGWNVVRFDAHDLDAIEQALRTAAGSRTAPTLLVGRTEIGRGAPHKCGTAAAHGEPLGREELAATKRRLGFDPDRSFRIGEQVLALCSNRIRELKRHAAIRDDMISDFFARRPGKKKLFEQLQNGFVPDDITARLLRAGPCRGTDHGIMQPAPGDVPALTVMAPFTSASQRSATDPSTLFGIGRYGAHTLPCGARELAMGACGNGMALFGTSMPCVVAPLLFADSMKPALRLAAMQRLHVLFVFSYPPPPIGGHGPLEQPAMLRSLPGLTVMRPAERHEIARAWSVALRRRGPVALLLPCRETEPLPDECTGAIRVEQGAYVLSDEPDFSTLLIATGTELVPALHAAARLRRNGRRVRVVSMPCRELFEAQTVSQREAVIPSACPRRVVIEAASSFGWWHYAGDAGMMMGVNRYDDAAGHRAWTPETIADRIEHYLEA